MGFFGWYPYTTFIPRQLTGQEENSDIAAVLSEGNLIVIIFKRRKQLLNELLCLLYTLIYELVQVKCIVTANQNSM